MKVKLQWQRKSRVEMIPLIDMMFLVLACFTYGMLFMAVHRSLPVHLPSSSTAQMDKSQLLSITVKADGAIFLEKKATTLGELSTLLRQKADENRERGVLLFADRSLPYQTLFKVLDTIRTAGLYRISLQAEAERGP
jgi:biopolymer transport protein ExbD